MRVLAGQVVDVSGRALETAQRIEADVSVLGFDLVEVRLPGVLVEGRGRRAGLGEGGWGAGAGWGGDVVVAGG